jgi:hypothetical protein
MIAIANGITKAGTIRRTGGDRRWDVERIRAICGSPWKLNIAGREDQSKEAAETDDSNVRFMTEEEKEAGAEIPEEDEVRPGRVRLMKEDYLEHGFTKGCRGCKALINKQRSQAHSEECRIRMEKVLESNEIGKERKRKADDRGNEWIAKKMQKKDQDVVPESSQEEASSSDRPNTLNHKRTGNERSEHSDKVELGEKRRKVEESVAADELLLEQINILEKCTSHDNLIEVFDSLRGDWEPDFYSYDPFEWEVSIFEDMCEPVKYSETNYDELYYDETTWEVLDAHHVAEAESEEMKRFNDRQVYSYVDRNTAMNDKDGKFV